MTTVAKTTPVTRSVTVLVAGHNPAPQGSKDYKGHRTDARTGKRTPVLVESCKRVGPWRDIVVRCTREAMRRQKAAPMDGAIRAEIIFTMAPPKSRSTKRRTWPNTRAYGDIDKLIRSTFDALDEGGAFVDDSRVTDVRVVKIFPGDPGALDTPGAAIRLTRIDTDA